VEAVVEAEGAGAEAVGSEEGSEKEKAAVGPEVAGSGKEPEARELKAEGRPALPWLPRLSNSEFRTR
jgi:hypothetical protein